MNIVLTPEQERLVRQSIDKGPFQSPEEVVGASLRLLQEREAGDGPQQVDLIREIQVGLEDVRQGRVRPFDPEDLMRRVRERLGEQAERTT